MKLQHKTFSPLLIISVFTVLGLNACKNTQKSAKTETDNTPKITYTTDVKPIIDGACGTKCHSAEKKAGHLDLSDYASVKNEVLHGELLDAIKHTGHVKAMPPKGAPLDSISIATIEKWAKAGAPK